MLQRCVEEAGIASLNAEANQAATSLKSDSMVVDAMAPLQPEDLEVFQLVEKGFLDGRAMSLSLYSATSSSSNSLAVLIVGSPR